MKDEAVQELVALAKSCFNNKDKKYNHQFDGLIEFKCQNFCIKYEFILGNIKSIKNTNIAYVNLIF